MNVQIPVKWLQGLLALCGPEDHELRERVMVSITAMDEQAARAVAVPDGWREKFAADVYADLAAADNQDVPLEEYPARILKVLDSIVGPRHPVVIKWRNDAIRNCIAIAYKYCRDPESHKYLKQDLEAMLTTEPAPQAQADTRDAWPSIESAPKGEFSKNALCGADKVEGWTERVATVAATRCSTCNYQHGHRIGCKNNPVDISLKAQGANPAVMEMLNRRRAKEEALIAQGKCPECEGEGVIGGQFNGGEWTCERCNGTGKFAAPVQEQQGVPTCTPSKS